MIVVGLFAAASVLHLHNAWVAFPLSGFDGTAHATYTGILHFEHRLPLAAEGWSTFHPPLYYALSALLWGLLPSDLDSHGVLFALRLINVTSLLVAGVAAYASARVLVPSRPNAALFAGAIVLFLPMYVGPAARMGNEMLAAALVAGSVWLLLRCLQEPDGSRHAVALGLVLGLAAITKFNALVALASAGAVLLLRGWQRHGRSLAALRTPATVGLVVLACAGWYYARNVHHYGVPIVIQTELVARDMKLLGYGPPREIGAYFSSRPDLLARPAERPPAARAAVWPSTFATIWYDVRGLTLDLHSAWSLRFRRLLFGCGLLISASAFAGLLAVSTGRMKVAVPLGAPALVLLGFLTLATYVGFTYRVATYSAIKGTYLSPGLVPFALFAALGLDLASDLGRIARACAWGFLGFFVASVLAISWSGWLAPTEFNPAFVYLRTHRDAATQRVARFFMDQPQRGDPSAHPWR
jgi:4-amino-4-deoxy-L-arabinose transferase-like glycosyltransferase